MKVWQYSLYCLQRRLATILEIVPALCEQAAQHHDGSWLFGVCLLCYIPCRPIGTNSGYLTAKLPIPVSPTGKVVELPPQTSSLTFNEKGEVSSGAAAVSYVVL